MIKKVPPVAKTPAPSHKLPPTKLALGHTVTPVISDAPVILGAPIALGTFPQSEERHSVSPKR